MMDPTPPSLRLEHGNVLPKPTTTTSGRRVPYLLLGSFAISLVCIAGAIAIAYTSNNAWKYGWIPAYDWYMAGHEPVQPWTLLALMTGVCTAAQIASLSSVGFRCDGAEAAGFFAGWRAIRSDVQARKTVIIALLAITASLAVGPLLQSSTHPAVVQGDDIEVTSTWGFYLGQVTNGWTGIVDPAAPANMTASSELQRVARAWRRNETLPSFWNSACIEECRAAAVPSPGLAINCSSTSRSIDLADAGDTDIEFFSVAFSRSEDTSNTPLLVMDVSYAWAADDTCSGTYTTDHCEVRSADTKYTVQINPTDPYLKLGRQPAGGVPELVLSPEPAVVSLTPHTGDAPGAKPGSQAGPLAGLAWVGHYYLESRATVQRTNGSGQRAVVPEGVTALEYMWLPAVDATPPPSECPFRWRNATGDLVAAMHELVFRMALETGNSLRTTPPGTQPEADVYSRISREILIYNTDFSLLWAAVSVMLSTSVTLLSLLWQYRANSKIPPS